MNASAPLRMPRRSWLVVCAAAAALAPGCGEPDGATPGDRPGGHAAAGLQAGRAGIEGLVRVDGRPAPARVTALRVHNPDVSRAGSLAWEWTWDAALATLEQPGLANGEVRRVDAAADGAFAFAGLAEGVYRIEAADADGRHARTLTIALDGTTGREAPRTRVVLDLAAGGYTLRGRVTRAGGVAFDGWVGLADGDSGGLAAPREAIAWTRARGGEFRFAGLSLATAKLVALDPGEAYAVSGVVRLPRADALAWELPAAGATWSGRVLAAHDDTPIGGADVLSFSEGRQEATVVTRVRTAADGTFAAPAAGHRTFLWANAAGMLPREIVEPADPADIVFRLPRGGIVEGRVVDRVTGEPVAGVGVYSTVPNESRVTAAPSRIETDADGRYRMTGVGLREVTIFALGGGHISPGLGAIKDIFYDPLAVDPGPGRTATHDLTVEPAGRLAGRLLDAGGAAVHGAAIAVIGSSWTGVAVAVTGPDGGFVCENLHPGATFWVRAAPPGLPTTWSDRLTVGSGETLEVALHAPRPRDVRVHVVDAATGAPVPGARVRMESRTSSGRVGAAQTRVTGTDGACVLRSSPAEAFEVTVAAPGHLERSLVAPTDADALEVALAPGHAITGRLRLPADVRLDWVNVQVTRHPPSYEDVLADDRLSATTIARVHGEDLLSFTAGELLPGRHGVTVSALAGRRWFAGDVEVDAGTDDVVVPLVAESDGNEEPRLELRVVGFDGREIPRFWVRYVERTEDGRSTARELTPTNGAVRLPPRTAGMRASLEVRRFEDAEGNKLPYGATEVRLPHGVRGPLEVRVDRGRTIEGRVLDAAGNPIPGVLVGAVPERDWEGGRPSRPQFHDGARSDRDGTFRIGRLGEQRYVLVPSRPPGTTRSGYPAVAAGARDVRIELQSAVDVTVTVIDDDGAPLAGCSVDAFRRSGTTGADGLAVLEDVDPRWRLPLLRIEPPEGRLDLRPFEETDWRPTDATFQLESCPVIEGRVAERGGEAVARGRIRLLDEAEMVPLGPGGRFAVRDPGRPTKAMVDVPNEANLGPGLSSIDHAVRPGVLNELFVDLGGRLRFRLEGWESSWARSPVPVVATLTRAGGKLGEPGSPRHVLAGGDGSFGFIGLDRDETYELRVGGVGRATGAVLRELRPGPDVHAVTLVPAGSLTVTVAPWDGEFRDVTVTLLLDDAHVRGIPDDDGRLHVHGLPRGRYEVRATSFLDVPYAAQSTLEVGVGSRVDLTLEPR